jgi:glycosyltransferase involved in cell wall biosynthesis
MRIGIDLTCLKAPMGGYERYASCLLRALVALPGSHRMVAFTERVYGPRLVPAGAEQQAFGTLPKFLLKVFLQDQTYWPMLMRRAHLDVVHTPIFAGMARAPQPYVLTVHDLIPLQTPEAISRSAAAYWRLVLPRAVARADAIITGAEFIRREILEHFQLPSERVAVIPHGVDARFAPVADTTTRDAVRRRYRLPPQFLLFVGIASPRKNLDRLVRAFGALTDDERGDTHLVLAGPPGWKNEALAAALAASRVPARIRHLGVVADDDLPALYAMAVGAVNLSSREGFGLPALEALACGAPLVCADRTAFPEVVGDDAWLVDPDDERATTAALATVIAGGPEVAARRARGVARARRYTWERSAAATLAIYHRVVA